MKLQQVTGALPRSCLCPYIFSILLKCFHFVVALSNAVAFSSLFSFMFTDVSRSFLWLLLVQQ